MDFLKDEGGILQIDQSILYLIAVCGLTGIMFASLGLGQPDLAKSSLLILGGFIGGKAIDAVSGSA